MKTRQTILSQKGPLKRAGLCGFRTCRLRKVFLKVTAATVAVSFFWTQNLWALDPRQKLIDDQLALATLSDGQKIGSAPLTTSFEASALDAVNHQETMASLQEASLPAAQTEPVLPAEIEAALNAPPVQSGTAAISYTQETKYQDVAKTLVVDSMKPYSKASGWTVNTTTKTLANATGNRALDYRFTMLEAGDLKFDLEALASGTKALPAGYAGFSIALYVDGVRKTVLTAAADKATYRFGSAQIAGITKGLHTLRLMWENDAPDLAAAKATKTAPAKAATGTELTIRKLVFTQITKRAYDPAVFAVTSVPPQATNQKQITVGYQVDGAAKQITFDLAEGVNQLRVEDVDKVGRKVTAAFAVTRDTQGPAVVVAQSPPLLTNISDLTIRYTVDDAPREKVITLQEGENTVYILEKDALGNPSYRIWNVKLDSIAPTITPLSDIQTLTNQSSLTVRYTADGVLKQKSFSLIEGSNPIAIEETDAAGNRAVWQKVIELDTIAPVVEVITAAPTLTHERDLTIRYRADGVEKNRVFALSEGLNQAVLEEADAAGNVTRQVFAVTLDTIAPEVILPAVQVVTNQKAFKVDYTSDGAARTYRADLIEGPNTLTIEEADAAGNRTVKTLQIVLDTLGPVIEVTNAILDITNQREHTIVYKADGVSREKTVTLAEGTNPITLEEADAAGNISRWTKIVTLDTVPPALTLAAEPQPLTNSDRVTVRYYQEGVFGQYDQVLAEGLNTIRITVTDPAGNTTTLTRVITRDSVPPAITDVLAPASLTKDASIVIRYKSDGVDRSKVFDLAIGENVLHVIESDLVGNIASREFTVTRADLPVLRVLGALTAATDAAAYEARYTLNGEERTKRFDLKVGENLLSLRDTDALGQEAEERIWVTRTGDGGAAAQNDFTLRTAGDDLLAYAQGQLTRINTSDGGTLQNIRLDGAGRIADAEVSLSDGSVEILENGQVIGIRRPDESRLLYRDGKIETLIAPDGKVTRFTYLTDRVIAVSNSARAVYQLDGQPIAVTDLTNGTLYAFEDGRLNSVAFSDGSEAIYDRQTITEASDPMFGYLYLAARKPVLRPGELPFLEGWLDPQTNHYIRIVTPEGTTLDFGTDGELDSARDADGNVTDFNISASVFGHFVGATIGQGGVASSYDAKGRLTVVTVNGLTIHYKDNSAEIDHIDEANGARIENIRLDADGHILDAVITTADGEERTYRDGHLLKVIQADDTEFGFTFDAQQEQSILSDILTRNKLRYTFEHQPDRIIATLDPAILPNGDTVIRMQYDTALNLKQATKQNNEVIQYTLDNHIAQIITPSEAAKVFEYAADGSYAVTQGTDRSFYDAANNLIKIVVAPHDGMTKTLEVGYQYGKIREVYELGGADGSVRTPLFKYAYIADPDGSELVQIQDLNENVLKTYLDGILLTALSADTSVLSTYRYVPDAADKVRSVEVTRLGRTLHTYVYDYQGTDTLVTDEEGVLRTYNGAQKLTFLEKNKQVFSYSYVTNPDGEEIVTETLMKKTLSDGSIVFYDPAASDGIQRIQKADGTVLTDIVLNSNNTFRQATVTLQDGTRKIFDNSKLLEEITADGTHFYYQDSRIARVTDRAGRDLTYTYDKDASGNVLQVWIKSGDALLKYDPSGDLLGLKLASVLTTDEVRSATIYSYEGGGYGPYSVDGDYATAQGSSSSRSFGRAQGSTSAYSCSTHTFSAPQTITRLDYQMSAGGNGWGAYSGNNHGNGSSGIEYQTAVGGPWIAVPGTGDMSRATKIVDLTGVIAIRAYAAGYGEGSDQGGCNAYAYIYELQYALADQTFLNYSEVKNAQGEVAESRLQGVLGAMSFDAQGRLVPGAFPASFAAPGQSLDGKMDLLGSKPYFSKLNAAAVDALWVATAREAVIDPSSVIAQEYSASGVLQTQIKADQTVTLFENNLPAKVLNGAGEVLIQYFYNADGHPSRVYLKNARDTLPVEVVKAEESIQFQRAAALRELAKQKNLAYQSIQTQASHLRQALQYQLNSLLAQYDDASGMEAKGKNARNQKSDALGQIGSAINDARNALISADKQEADAYANLDGQVKVVSDQIEADSARAFVSLAAQEALMKHEILKQEISPLVYDAYRRILGRDPSSVEYTDWTNQVDYGFDPLNPSEIQKTLDGKPLTQALNDFLAALPELAERTAYVQSIKTSVRSAVTNYLTLSAADKAAFASSLGLSSENLIDLSSSDAQKILVWLDTRSLHFGQSAFLSLESLLDQKGIHYAREDVAHKAILIDILTGVISPLDDGDLVISVFALNTVAASYGLSLAGANVSWDDLKSYYDKNRLEVKERTVESQGPGSSVDLGSGSGYLTTPDPTSDFDFGEGDFTLESWVKLDGSSNFNTIATKNTRPGGWIFYVGGDGIGLYYNWDVGSLRADVAVSSNSWHHVAASRQGNVLRFFLDGKVVGTSNVSGITYGGGSSDLYVGGYNNGVSGLFHGKIDELNISRSARYAADFVPSDIRRDVDSSTRLLMRSSSAGSAPSDFSGKNHVLAAHGTVNTTTDHALKIKTFITEKYLARNGLDVTSEYQGRLDQAFLNPGQFNPRMIAHISGNHYVVITGITDTTITYIDPGAGPDKHNEIVTATKAQFMKAWKGNVLAEKSVVDAAVQASPATARILSTSETQQIRGAFFVFLIPIAIAIFSGVGAAIAGIAATVGAIAAGVGAIVGSAIATMGSVIAGIGSLIGSLATTLFTGITAGFTSLFGTIGGSSVLGIGGAASGGLVGGFGGGLVGTLAQSAITIGLNLAVTKGLEALGVNATISNLIGSFVTGGLSSGFKLGFSASNLLVGGLKGVALTGSQTLLQKVGFDAQLSSALSLITSPLIDGIQQGNIGNQLVKIIPSIEQNLAMYGVDRLSQSIGIDPILGRTFALPFLAQNPFGSGPNILNRPISDLIKESVVHGALQLGLKFTSDQISKNPLLRALSVNILSGALSMVLGDNFSLVERVGAFITQTTQQIFTRLQNGGYEGMITSKGALGVLEAAVTDVLNRESLEEVHKLGGIADTIVQRSSYTTVNGQLVKEVRVTPNQSIYLDSNDRLKGVKTYDRIDFGRYEYNENGKLVLAEGTTTQIDPNTGQQVRHEVSNGAQISVSYGSGETPMIRIVMPQGAISSPMITPEGLAIGGMLQLPGYSMNLNINDWNMGLWNMSFQNLHSRPQLPFIPADIHIKDVGTPTNYVLLNGLNPDFTNLGNYAPYFDPTMPGSFVDTLIDNNVAGRNEIESFALYSAPTLLPDLITWYYDATNTVSSVTDYVRDALDSIQKDQTSSYTVMAYSGAGSPLLKALNYLSNENSQPYPVKSVILVGAPFLEDGTTVTHADQTTLINVYGENDMFQSELEKSIQKIRGIYEAVKELAKINPLVDKIYRRIDFAADKAFQSVGVMIALSELILRGDIRGFGTWAQSMFSLSEITEAITLLTGTDSQFAQILAEKYDLVKDTATFSVPVIRKDFEGFKKSYNILLKGVSHFDYFVSPSERATLPLDSIKLKTEKFMAKLAAASSDDAQLERFLSQNGNYVFPPGQYEIDTANFV